MKKHHFVHLNISKDARPFSFKLLFHACACSCMYLQCTEACMPAPSNSEVENPTLAVFLHPRRRSARLVSRRQPQQRQLVVVSRSLWSGRPRRPAWSRRSQARPVGFLRRWRKRPSAPSHAAHQAWPISSTWPQKPQSSASSLS